MFVCNKKEILDGDVNENDKRSSGLSQDDDEEDDEDEDIPGKQAQGHSVGNPLLRSVVFVFEKL